jgi:2-hydroxymuconate-semialdehyde hydrolase
MAQKEFTAADIESYFGYQSHWLSTRPGERIHYLDEGDSNAVAVILIHGSAIGITGAANFYLTIPPLVEAGFRALVPDLYGYGWTESAEGVEPTIFNQQDQIVRFMDEMGIEQAYLIGNSLGGRVSTRVTMANSNRILGNIVIGTGGATWKPGPRSAYKFTSTTEEKVVGRQMVQEAMHRMVDNVAVVPDQLVDFRTRMALRPGADERHRNATYHRNSSAKAAGFDEECANSCEVPTLFIYGREDSLSPPENALAGAEAFPNADMMLFGHCGHWTMVERADDFNALMLRFIRGYDRRIVSPPLRSNDLRGGDLVKDE